MFVLVLGCHSLMPGSSAVVVDKIPALVLVSSRSPGDSVVNLSFWLSLFSLSDLVSFCDGLVSFCDGLVSFCDGLVSFCDGLVSFCDGLVSFCDNGDEVLRFGDIAFGVNGVMVASTLVCLFEGGDVGFDDAWFEISNDDADSLDDLIDDVDDELDSPLNESDFFIFPSSTIICAVVGLCGVLLVGFHDDSPHTVMRVR